VNGRRWDFGPTPARKKVDGGAVVAKPGAVLKDDAVALVRAAELEARPTILARARTYARAGQVMSVAVGDGAISGEIQGSDAEPYRVRLERTTISGSERVAASCDCPYGCDFDWCKHAAALAYVGAYLIERDPGAMARWTGREEPGGFPGPGGVLAASALVVDEELLAALRATPPPFDPARAMEAASRIVPLP